MKFVLCGGLVVAASGCEDEDGHSAGGEHGLVPGALRPCSCCRKRQRRERGVEVDAHVGIFVSRCCLFDVLQPTIPAMRPPV
jgi:hypothetical protein